MHGWRTRLGLTLHGGVSGGGFELRAAITVLLSLFLAVAIDIVAPWPFVMTPLYLVPVLVAAHSFGPRIVAGVGLAIVVVNVISSAVQDMPVTVWPLYTAGLALSVYLATGFARERAETQRSRERLSRFTSMIAHDLRNSVAALDAYGQLLRRQGIADLPELAAKMLAATEGASARIKRLTEDLADTTSLINGQFRLRPSRMDLAELARSIVDLRRATAEHHRLRLEAPAHLEGVWDQDRLGQLLLNLVSNAVKYSPQGGEVTVRVEAVPDGAVIRVSDEGVGVPSEKLDDLFQPFMRLDSLPGVQGTGLGLFIAKGIVDAHGGQIMVTSSVGNGSTFSVWLPSLTAPEGVPEMRQTAVQGQPAR